MYTANKGRYSTTTTKTHRAIYVLFFLCIKQESTTLHATGDSTLYNPVEQLGGT
jgi:hypothetical protein